MTRSHANLLLVVIAALWGFAFLFQKTAMAHVGPVQFVAARAVVACLALLPLAIYEMRGSGAAWGGVLRAGIPAGIVFFIGAVLQQAGLVTATVTNTGFLTALYVVMTPFIAWLLLSRRPPRVVWTAVALSFCGMWLLGGGGISGFSGGDGLVAISAAFWALHVVLVGRAGPLGRPVAFTTVQFMAVALLGLVFAPQVETVSVAGLQNAWIEIAYVGVISSALTFTLLSVAVRHTGPSEASIIVSTETLFAAAAAWALLGERLPPIGWAGAGLILLATMVVQLAPRRRDAAAVAAPKAREREDASP